MSMSPVCSYLGRRAGPPTGRMRVVRVRQREATKGEQIQGFGPKYEWGEALKHKEMPERDCGHSSWVGYPSGGSEGGGYPTKQEWCHLTVAYLIREKPVPNRASSVPTTTVPGVRGGRRGTRIQAPLAREEDTGRKHATNSRANACQGRKERRSPITHIRRRLATCAWKHGEAGLTRRRRVWVGRHMRSMCVTAGWGSHRHEKCGVLTMNVTT